MSDTMTSGAVNARRSRGFRWFARSAFVLALAAVLMPLAAQSAQASGSFYWAADISKSIESRKWEQNAGTTTIAAYVACGTKALKEQGINITLYFKGESRGKRNFICGNSNQRQSWPNLPSSLSGPDKNATYHFLLTKPSDGVTVHISGDVRYP